MKINHTDLATLFSTIGTSFIGVDITTFPVTKNTGKYHNTGKIKTVRKHSTFTAFAMSGSSAYERRVNTKVNKALAENFGDIDLSIPAFNAKTLWGGKGRHGEGCNIFHADTKKQYVFLYCDVSRMKPVVSYSDMNGAPVNKADVIEVEKVNVKDVDLGNGVTVTVAIMPRTVAFESIDRVRIDGQEFTVDHETVVLQDIGEALTAGKAERPAPISVAERYGEISPFDFQNL